MFPIYFLKTMGVARGRGESPRRNRKNCWRKLVLFPKALFFEKFSNFRKNKEIKFSIEFSSTDFKNFQNFPTICVFRPNASSTIRANSGAKYSDLPPRRVVLHSLVDCSSKARGKFLLDTPKCWTCLLKFFKHFYLGEFVNSVFTFG